ncbi:MAG: 16S rRNA (guanine(966)-N(2))-methyltransferase RsmD [Actinomycetaceae bacterium]|nr:16S rRNA (guanine(966)-N(2))-methyltransferase RsmD [Actinomycetaceae bacterium]MDU0970071.1 16S rRNA (guanine(966)-N(2))-methyltransferase RsmD [Actinomycetaceae bacterium]
MTRIVAGSAKGAALKVPSQGTRPTSDRVREAIFSRLASWGAIERARVLDLYAGSGALGLEALSRGARSADLVDASEQACRVARANARSTGLGARVYRADAAAYLGRGGEWDLVFADPPYALDSAELDRVIALIGEHVSDDAVVVIERATRDGAPAPAPWGSAWESKAYGETTVWYSDVAQKDA